MATSIRPSHLLTLSALLVLAFAVSCHASPIERPDAAIPHFLSRRSASIIYDSAGHIVNVTDATTNAPIAQGSATDGSGTGSDASSIIWLVFSFVTGVPLMLGGLRLWRMTTGIGIGLAAAVCLWASFANTVGAKGVSDLVITLISVGSFVLGFAIGVFELGYAAGIAIMSILGGFSIGARIVLFRSDLLVHTFFVNWLIITGCGLLCFLLLLARQRVAVVICTSAAGTFMTALGVDMAVNEQKGLSFGLRYLFDRNSAHIEYLYSPGWRPPISSIIIIAVSLAFIPILAYAQHMVYKSPFRRPRSDSVASFQSVNSRPPSEEASSTAESTEKKSAALLSDDRTVELNSVHERGTPTPNPSINSFAKLLPQKPKSPET